MMMVRKVKAKRADPVHGQDNCAHGQPKVAASALHLDEEARGLLRNILSSPVGDAPRRDERLRRPATTVNPLRVGARAVKPA
jgi:hypothetical protein